MKWPTEWDQILDSRIDTSDPYSVYDPYSHYVPPTPNEIREIERKSVRFTGKGLDDDKRFFSRGWLTPLSRQADIPGWQRMTMMRHENPDLAASVHEENKAYEGVVLPGGRMILGRWWSTVEVEYYSRHVRIRSFQSNEHSLTYTSRADHSSSGLSSLRTQRPRIHPASSLGICRMMNG